MKDALQSMRVFVRVVEAGSFARAADTLGLLRPAVTRHIQALEDRLRTRLLNRTTRRLAVTPAGSRYHERVVRLLAELDRIEADFGEARGLARGDLRVDLPAMLAREVILPALPGFLSRHPELRIDIRIRERLADLRADNIDVALCTGAVADESLVACQVGLIRFVTVASPDYLARHGLPHQPSDLARPGHQVLGACSPDARIDATRTLRLRIDETGALAGAALAGAGVARLPCFVARRHLASGELVALLADWPPMPLPLQIVTLPGRFRATKVSLFRDWLIERLASDPRFRDHAPAAAAERRPPATRHRSVYSGRCPDPQGGVAS